MLGDVVEEFALDGEGPARERNLRFALRADMVDMIAEQPGDMGGVGRRGDGDHGLGFRNLSGGGKDRGAPEAVADQDRGRFPCLAQMSGGADEIGDVGGEGRIGEIALARTKPGEIEAERGDALGRERDRDALGGQYILAAGEAMREQRVGDRRPIGQVKRGGELVSAFAFKLEFFSRHMSLPELAAHLSLWAKACTQFLLPRWNRV